MKPLGALLPFEDAMKVVEAIIKPLERTETVALDDALGRVLVEDFVALLDTPPFNRSAMDGYAVIAEDTTGSGDVKPKVLGMIGKIHAGDAPSKAIAAGQCMQIATGAMLPEGADAVVIVEDTEASDGRVKIFKPAVPGQNVGKIGGDIQKGETVVEKGMVLDAAKIGVLASQGVMSITVYARPKVAVLSSGEEVKEAGEPLQPGQIYNINSHTASSVVRENGGLPVKLAVVGDTREDIRAKLKAAMDDSDLVVISGGASAGERDLLVGVLNELGTVYFHGVQIKPGKPTMFASIEGKPLFGMPGHPTSCLMNSYLFLRPVVRKMGHLPPSPGKTVEAKLGSRISGGAGRKQFLTVKVEDGEVFSVFKESSAITSMAAADGYIEIEQNVDFLEKGALVTVTLF